VPYKEITSIVPSAMYKKHKKTWEGDSLDAWDKYSNELQDTTEGVNLFISKCATKKYYGYSLFWVENYKDQKGLKKKMWLAVNHQRMVLVSENLAEEIVEYDYEH
jgi:hypothetical protein